MKKRECVNCLWNSKKSNGSVFDDIRTSRSGAMPATHPRKVAIFILVFFVIDCEKLAPMAA